MAVMARLGRLFRGFLGLFISGLEERNPEALMEAARQDFRNKMAQYNMALAQMAGVAERLKSQIKGKTARAQELERRILALAPANTEQKWFQSQALQLTNALSQIHRLANSQKAAASPPWAVLIVVLLCSAFIFAGFGLYVPPNTTVVFSFTVAALAVAAAIFLIVDLGDPFSGFLQISSMLAHATFNQLGK